MNRSLISAAVSLRGLQQKIDVIADNVAHVNTPGYKRKEASFLDVLTTVRQQPADFRKEGRLTPLGYPEAWGARLGLVQLVFTQGTLKETGNPLDLAIEGDAVFEVDVPTPDGAGNMTNETRWTRNGSLSLSINPEDPETLLLTTKDGYALKGVDDEPVVIPAQHRISVSEDGTVMAYDDRNPEAPPVAVGQLKLLRVAHPQLLEPAGHNLYKLPDHLNLAGDEVLVPVDAESANGGARVAVRQGYVEQSNVSLADEMAELVQAQRAYQLNSRAIQSADAMMNLANNLRG